MRVILSPRFELVSCELVGEGSEQPRITRASISANESAHMQLLFRSFARGEALAQDDKLGFCIHWIGLCLQTRS